MRKLRRSVRFFQRPRDVGKANFRTLKWDKIIFVFCCILTGDFNLNLLKHAKSPGVSKFLENLLSHNFMPQITLPTRITEKTTTLIDNMLINNNILNCISGNITTSISDHLPQFIVLDSLLGTSTDVDSSQILYRSFKNFSEENFSNDITEINRNFCNRKQ